MTKEKTTELDKRERTLILFDVDNTLINGYSVFLFAEFLAEKGLFDKNSLASMYLAMETYKSDHNYRKFAIEAVNSYSEGLKGQKQKEIEAASQQFLPRYVQHLLPHSLELVRLMSVQGETLAISGAPREAFEPLAKILGIQQSYLLEAEILDGAYTGKTETNMSLDEEKRRIVSQLSMEGFNPVVSFAFGDSVHDIPLLEAVSNPFAISPSPQLLEIAQANNWSIVTGDSILEEVKKRLAEIHR